MSPPHLRPEEAEQYVLGALSPEAAQALEQHTLQCDACARLLQREALLEEQLREVVRSVPAQKGLVRPSRWHEARLPALVGGLAALAAGLLLLVSRPGPSLPTPAVEETSATELPLELSRAPARLVACPDPTSQDTCVAQAQARGLLVQFPQGVGEVPRYEGHAGFPRELASGPSFL